MKPGAGEPACTRGGQELHTFSGGHGFKGKWGGGTVRGSRKNACFHLQAEKVYLNIHR